MIIRYTEDPDYEDSDLFTYFEDEYLSPTIPSPDRPSSYRRPLNGFG